MSEFYVMMLGILIGCIGGIFLVLYTVDPISSTKCIDGKVNVLSKVESGEHKLFPLPVECGDE
ncbi:MAG: hypothetical protein KAS32_08600 [Candidatus Peribacteraceae bacterium]|nr:hypothetical protein [Candidatus Peribacteraceae bacterium]